jgi:hypothetical protein
MLEVLAEQTRTQIIEETQHEIELILQQLVKLEKHRQLGKPLSRREGPPTTLAGIVEKAEDQATTQGLSQKKKWLLLAEHLEDAHRFGIYNEPINTICRLICLINPSVKPNTVRKALTDKYKEPHQSKIARRQAKGLTASIYRYHKQKMKLRYSTQVPEQDLAQVNVSSSVTPYKDMARSSYYYTFAGWIIRCKRKKYNTGIFEKIKKDKAFRYVCTDIEFALWYIEEVYHPSKKEFFAVRKAMEIYKREKQR